MAYTTTVDVSSVAGSPYEWENAAFAWQDPDAAKNWATAYPLAYTVCVGEGWATDEAQTNEYVLTPHEGWQTAELLTRAMAQVISEAFRLGEVWADVWQPMVRVFEMWTTADLLANSATISNTESCQLVEDSSRASQLNIPDGWQTDDAWAQQFQLRQLESLLMAELDARAVSRTVQEALFVADSPPVWAATKTFLEAWANSETMTHTWQDFLTFVESWTTTETPQMAATKNIFQSWATAEARTATMAKVLADGWSLADTLATTTIFQRLFTEACRVAEGMSNNQLKVVLEALAADDEYLRNANAVISDLAFASGDLTLEQFTGLVSSPAGYGPFTGFIPGELEYQKALIALILSGPLTAGRPRVNEWKLTVDVPDRTDGGTLVLPAAVRFIPFKVRFFAPPEVIVQLRGGSTGTPDITGITEAGFYVQLKDANGNPVAGDIIWSALGY